MASRRKSSEDVLNLFPFLDIVSCLIGVLVLLIVLLVISQKNNTGGRTMEEIQMSQEYVETKREIEKRNQDNQILKEKLALLEEIEREIEEQMQRFIKLRRLRDTGKDAQERNKEIALQLQKELDDLIVEIEGLKKQQAESKKEIAELLAMIEERKISQDQPPPPVQVQPSGSGMGSGTKVYFVEASGGGLKLLQPWSDEDYRLSARPETVVADHAFNHFLLELQKDENSLILFLIRDDGYGAFNNGAGRAESDYGIRIGKLPIPGRGELQLDLFDEFRGRIDPPPPPASANP
jgi:hypothetical protein